MTNEKLQQISTATTNKIQTESALNGNIQSTTNNWDNRFPYKQQEKLSSYTLDYRNHWWKVCWFHSGGDKNAIWLNSIQRLRRDENKSTCGYDANHSGNRTLPHQKSPLSSKKQINSTSFQWPSNKHIASKVVETLQENGDPKDGINENRNQKVKMLTNATLATTNSLSQINIPSKAATMFCPRTLPKNMNFDHHRTSLDDMSSPLVVISNNHQQPTESKSMTTLALNNSSSNYNNQQQPMQVFTLPRKMMIENKNNFVMHKEMARFYNQQQQQFYVSQIFSNKKIIQPISFLTKGRKIDSNHNRIVQLLIDLKGSVWRDKQLEYQMPPQDEQLFSQQQNPESKFIKNKRRKALVRTELSRLSSSTSKESCHKCKTEIPFETHCVKIIIPQYVFSSLNNNNDSSNNGNTTNTTITFSRYYHIDCLTCIECNQVLVDLKAYVNPVPPHHQHNRTKYLEQNQNQHDLPPQFNLYCSRHFVELFKPRCPSCDKLIFDEECTEAEGKAWHIGHFCCTECKRSLGGQQYIMAHANNNLDSEHQLDCQQNKQQMPYCLACFDILFGELCEECGELIGCEVGAIVHEGRSWHANERCFRCSLCLKNLLGKPFLPALDGRIYCSISCSQAMIAHRKKRLKKQNKLQTLNVTQNENQKSLMANKLPEYEKEAILQQQKTSVSTTTTAVSETIKQNRQNFMKSIIRDATEVTTEKQQPQLPENNSQQEKLKDFNFSQVIDYVEFIKKNNQCFTSKYDWSKEQEFQSVIDRYSDDISLNHHQHHNNIHMKLNIHESAPNGNASKNTKPTEWTYKNMKPLNNCSNPMAQHAATASIDILSTSTPLSSSHHHQLTFVDSSRSTIINSFHMNSTNYGSMNSPTFSSTEQTTNSTQTSPPPEYANIDHLLNNEENSSNSSSQLNHNVVRTPVMPIYMTPPKDKSIIISTNGTVLPNNNFKFNVNNIESTIPESCSPVTSKDSNDEMQEEKSSKLDELPTANQCEQNKQISRHETNLNSSKSKSVSFDPNIKDDENETTKRSIRRRIRSLGIDEEEEDDDDFSDSCSSCSTCSSSDDDDDDEDEFDLLNGLNNVTSNFNKQQKSKNTIINTTNINNNNNKNNYEQCIIS